MKDKNIKAVTLAHSEAKNLFDDLTDDKLNTDQKKILRGAVNLHIHLAEKLKDRTFKIKDIREIFGIDLQKNNNESNQNTGSTGNESQTEESASSADKDDDDPDPDPENDKPQKSTKTGGRVPHHMYTGLNSTYLNNKYTIGQRCPDCQLGNLNEYKDKVVIRLDGSLGQKLHVEQFRCGTCQTVFTADYSKYGEDKYNTVFKSKVIIEKYWSGMPFKRSEAYYDMIGCPISDSTLWSLVEGVSEIVEPVYDQVIKYASDSDTILLDDTQARILSRITELKHSESTRTGTFTTGFVCTRIAMGDPEVVLYMNGKNHMGENLSDLLSHRTKPLNKLVVMTDGLDNLLSELMDAIMCNCMSHGFRKFKEEVLVAFPVESQYIMLELKKVFVNDAEIKKRKMSQEERLAYHQEHSTPVMNNLKEWLDKQMDEKLVEPNSTLGKAIKYMLGRWTKLTEFCRTVGAPLDNNGVERILKIAIRTRKSAMFYKTEDSARVAGIMMTMIETCRRNQINPLKYLTYLQDNVLRVIKHPKEFLPWLYTEGRIKLALAS